MHPPRVLKTLTLVGVALLGSHMVPLQAEEEGMESIARGRYLVQIAGCNDCHTAGYLLANGAVPEEQWLTGDTFGWRGPWGTTYPVNLRLRLQEFSAEQWLKFAREFEARPPMPWYTLHLMTDADLLAIYRYVRHLGPAGTAAPAFVPPEQEPDPPYALFPPAPN